jgi:NADH-quinone oxidoreductase subunit N
MNAPTLWIIIPIVLGILLLLINNQRVLSVLGGSFAVALAVIAQFVPIEVALKVGSYSFRIDAAFSILGRSLVIPPTEGSLLALIYGAAALWFFGAEASKTATRLVPLGFMIIALLVASIAVQPFLYAALFIEMAILIAIPMLTSIYRPPGRGVVRFLIYQTLAMPFILLAGWLLAGVEASPGDLALTAQSAAMLGMGFAFLLAIFPLYSWIPLLIEENSPYIVGFLLWILLFAAVDPRPALSGSADGRHRRRLRGIPAPPWPDHGIWLDRRNGLFPVGTQPGPQIRDPDLVSAYPGAGARVGSLVPFPHCD